MPAQHTTAGPLRRAARGRAGPRHRRRREDRGCSRRRRPAGAADRLAGGRSRCGAVRTEVGSLIFKAVREGRPYPEHGMSTKDWAMIPPRQIRLDTLVTTKRELALDALLADDSTFYGDLFPHAVLWHGEMYLEDGLHRALRAALQQRTVIHVRVLDLDALMPAEPAR
ncbi:type II toxin-antitoxin system VapB family antitoxin [Blastococcus sp. SYSU D00813]